MLRTITIAFLAMAFITACGSKDTKPEGENPDTMGAMDDPGIESKTMGTIDPGGSDSGNIPGLSSINFGYDQATLDSSARDQLASNAEWIRGNSNMTIQVEGHCDERGSIEYNLSLGERRAKAVKNYLVSLGVDPARLTIISYGEEKPLERGSSESAWARNRRANFVPLPQ